MSDLPKFPFQPGWDYFQGWSSQFARVERWHDRLLFAQSEFMLNDQEGRHDYWDIAFAFFQNSYHLKDWIQYEFPELRSKLELLISEDPSLSYCADICNGTKHREASRNNRVPGHLIGIRQYAPRERTKQTLHILGPDGPMLVNTLAEGCLKAWRTFIATHETQLGAQRSTTNRD